MVESPPGCWECCPATCAGIRPLSTAKDSGVASGKLLELKKFGESTPEQVGLVLLISRCDFRASFYIYFLISFSNCFLEFCSAGQNNLNINMCHSIAPV